LIVGFLVRIRIGVPPGDLGQRALKASTVKRELRAPMLSNRVLEVVRLDASLGVGRLGKAPSGSCAGAS
jgi:hypothetical protein